MRELDEPVDDGEVEEIMDAESDVILIVDDDRDEDNKDDTELDADVEVEEEDVEEVV
jgi:hypothetical protein